MIGHHQNPLPLPPGLYINPGICSHHKKNVGIGVKRDKLRQSFDSVPLLTVLQLQCGNGNSCIVVCRERKHGKSVVSGCRSSVRLVRRMESGKKDELIELEQSEEVFCDCDMSAVHRIERSTVK